MSTLTGRAADPAFQALDLRNTIGKRWPGLQTCLSDGVMLDLVARHGRDFDACIAELTETAPFVLVPANDAAGPLVLGPYQNLLEAERSLHFRHGDQRARAEWNIMPMRDGSGNHPWWRIRRALNQIRRPGPGHPERISNGLDAIDLDLKLAACPEHSGR